MKLEFETVTKFGEFNAIVKENHDMADFNFIVVVTENSSGKTNLTEWFETKEDAKQWLEKVMPKLKTLDEIQSLKNQWVRDDIWELEEAEGFELYTDELKIFSDEIREKRVTENERAYNQFVHAVMEKYDCSFKMAEHVARLEGRIIKIENKMELLKISCFGE